MPSHQQPHPNYTLLSTNQKQSNTSLEYGKELGRERHTVIILQD
jgi:hypothetical protein